MMWLIAAFAAGFLGGGALVFVMWVWVGLREQKRPEPPFWGDK